MKHLLLVISLCLSACLQATAQNITFREVNFTLKEEDKALIQRLIDYEVKIYNGLFQTVENDSIEIKLNLYKPKDFRALLKNTEMKGFTESGFYSPRTNESHVLYNDQANIPVILHEVSHALLRNNFSHPPRWFNEGLAVFLESLEENNRNIQVYTNHHYLNFCREQSREKNVNLREFFTSAQSHWQDKGELRYMYSVSYGIVYMLIKKDPKLIGRMLTMLKEGKSELEIFGILFGSFRNFESHFKFYYR